MSKSLKFFSVSLDICTLRFFILLLSRLNEQNHKIGSLLTETAIEYKTMIA